MPGMNSGLSPSDPTLVAAFRSALMHQGAIALLMLVLVWFLWATARTWRSAATPAALATAGATAGGNAEARARWLLRTGFGVLWIFDGILQAQVIRPIAASSPGRVQHLVNWGGTAGRWAPLVTLGALAASAPGRSCGLEGVSAASFGTNENPMAAGSCARPGAAGVFTDAGGTWRSAGLALPGRGPRAGGTEALLAAGNQLLAAWWDGTLAPGAGGSLAVSRSRLTVWRLARGTWARVQQLTVPVQYGSSG